MLKNQVGVSKDSLRQAKNAASTSNDFAIGIIEEEEFAYQDNKAASRNSTQRKDWTTILNIYKSKRRTN